MRYLLNLITCIYTSLLFAQPETEVYLFDISNKGNILSLKNQRNISNNPGYDNQPYFYNDNIVLFASTRNGQTDIASYNIRDNKTDWISETPGGSEYSPTKIPNQKAVSAIRLDTTGKQLLYQYDFKTGKSKVLIKDLVIGYHTWYTEDIIISSVLEDGGLSLVVSNLKDNSNYTFQKKVGRSLHKIPNTKLISYISKERDIWEIKSLHPITGETKKIAPTVDKTEDMCWLINGTILMAKDNIIYQYNPKTNADWSVFYTATDQNIHKITRIAVNTTSGLLALVAEKVDE